MKKRYTKTRLQELNYKWKKGNLSPAEQLDLDEWEKNLDDDTLYLPEEYKDQPELIRDRITQKVINRINNPAYKAKQTTKLWPRIGIAAAVAAIIVSVGIWFLKNPAKEDPIQQSAYLNDVAPGKQGATLTLANGKKIRLADAVNGQIANEAGISVTKTADGQLVYEVKPSMPSASLPEGERNAMNTLSTANGETYKLRLPDGSFVWLNAASSLTYTANLMENGQRRVKLTGEGYFEIAKDKAHPFIVKTDKQEVEVLGTHFNINSYADEPFIKTTLLEGSVKINQNTILKPGQQSRLSKAGSISVETADIETATAWINAKFVFEREEIESVMRMLSRWYNVEVAYQGDVKNMTFTGSISRYDNISKILDKISYTGTIHFKIEGRRITVMP